MGEIVVEDFGGRGERLHFAHANGYPPGCYRQMLDFLSGYYHVLAIQQRPLWPESRPQAITGWQDMADDLIRACEAHRFSSVIGVGHSLGAVVTMMAAVKRPELFRTLVLIEPVFLMPAILTLFSMNPNATQSLDFPLVKIASSRRNEWASHEEAFTHFRRKRVFQGWSDATLWDYIHFGLRERSDGRLVLAYPPEWEARIYALPPTDVWELLPQVTQSTLAIRGDKSDTLVPGAWEMWRFNQPNATFLEIAGAGHLLPMEKPQELGQAILKFLRGVRIAD